MNPVHEDDEAVLSQFREWLSTARGEAEQTTFAAPGDESEFLDDAVGLYRLVEEFTALRHEIKLQTKSARGLAEQAQTASTVLTEAVERFRQAQPLLERSARALAKPAVESMADLHEALQRGQAEIEKARGRLSDEEAPALAHALDQLFARQPWWRRLLLRSCRRAVGELVRRQARDSAAKVFDALLEGYSLIQGRLRRAMAAEDLRPIDCRGLPVDPKTMTVLEVVDDPSRPAGTVVDEIRAGYTWKGDVLRFAEVRAVRA